MKKKPSLWMLAAVAFASYRYGRVLVLRPDAGRSYADRILFPRRRLRLHRHRCERPHHHPSLRYTIMKSLAIRSVRVIDGTGRTIERATVVVRGTTIAAVGSDRDLSLPRGAARVDGRGLTLLPGLIDCHVHLCLGAEPDVVDAIARETPTLTLLKSSQAARLTLEAGFTTVRDVGSRDHSTLYVATGHRRRTRSRASHCRRRPGDLHDRRPRPVYRSGSGRDGASPFRRARANRRRGRRH